MAVASAETEIPVDHGGVKQWSHSLSNTMETNLADEDGLPDIAQYLAESNYEIQEPSLCPFRILSNRPLLKESIPEDPCTCADPTTSARDWLSGWESVSKSCGDVNNKRAQKRNRRHPPRFNRDVTDMNSSKAGNAYRFRHFNDLRKYMDQYRYFQTDGDVGKGFAEDRVLGKDPYPYLMKLRRYK